MKVRCRPVTLDNPFVCFIRITCTTKLHQHPNPRYTHPNPRQSPLEVLSPEILPSSSPQPGADSVDAVSSVSRASRRGAKRRLWRRGAMRNRRGVDLSTAARGGSDGRNSTMPITKNTHTHTYTQFQVTRLFPHHNSGHFNTAELLRSRLCASRFKVLAHSRSRPCAQARYNKRQPASASLSHSAGA